jgi:sialate O-acetylesterase
VPIGLVSTNWGGTKAEAWTSRETIQEFGQFDETMELLADPAKRNADFKIHQNQPTVLYNAMIAPLTPMRIAGAIWYQGESNCYDPIGYRTLFPAMITDWRTQWDQGDFPFYFVQIAPFEYGPKRGRSQAIREAQMMTLDAVDNVGMAVTTDIGKEKDIHPRNKHDVGDRLARWALAKTYGKKGIVYSGPIYAGMKVEGNKILLGFNPCDLVAKDGKLTDFIIAGEDRQFVPAKAEIRKYSKQFGKSTVTDYAIVVWSDEVKEPVAVRYGWSNWVDGSLFNKAGLSASSFRTDDWPLE